MTGTAITKARLPQGLEPYVGDFIQRPSPNHGYGAAVPNWRAVTWHIAEGGLEATLEWLTDPASNASAHFVIARDGTIYQLVGLDAAAWCQGKMCEPDVLNPIVRDTFIRRVNPNLVSYSIECVGYSQHGFAGALTLPQADALVRVTSYLCYKARLRADRTHILGHYQWDSCTRPYCPGYSEGEWATWVARVRALTLLWRGW